LEEIFLRIARAKTLEEAQELAFALWHLIRATKEGLKCPLCFLRASDVAEAHRESLPPLEDPEPDAG